MEWAFRNIDFKIRHRDVNWKYLFRQLAPDSVGQVLKQVGLSLPVSEISKNLKRLTPDEASCAIQRAKIEKLSLETVTAGLKLMRADVVSFNHFGTHFHSINCFN